MPDKNLKITRSFVIATSVIHAEWENQVYAYEPYVREADLWLSHFDKCRIIAPVVARRPEKNEVPYGKKDIDFKRVPLIGGLSLASKLRSILCLPYLQLLIGRYVRGYEHLHLRLPGNIGFFTLLLCPLLSVHKTAKVASQWGHYPGEPWSVKIQKLLVSTPWWFRNGKVLVYGQWPDMPAHVVSFFTASYWQKEIATASECAARKEIKHGSVIRLAFVGRLSANKAGDIAIRATKTLCAQGVDAELHVVGDGAEMAKLKDLASELGIAERIIFYGNQPKAVVAQVFQKAEFVLSLSQTEGWPKVVAEGMVWGAVPVATAVSCIPWMLDNEKRGRLVERSPESVARAVENYYRNPSEYSAAARRSHEWSKQYTLETFEKAIGELV
jgi:glycosyltransferase involved in cell wall biosynthesis